MAHEEFASQAGLDPNLFNDFIDRLPPEMVEDMQQMYRRPDRPDSNTEEAWKKREWTSSISHAGCVNTACWIDAPWRFVGSDPLSVNESVHPLETTHHLATSGDDRIVKIWDCRDSMGFASPLAGGWDTLCPFSGDEPAKDFEFGDIVTKTVSGSVKQIAQMTTGHAANVFNVSPVNSRPGCMLSSGADGQLRLLDLVSNTSKRILKARTDGMDGYGSPMAYSHVQTTEDTGLLCCESGLFRFDLRVPQSQQPNANLMVTSGLCYEDSLEDGVSCKACIPWHESNMSVEPNYIFCGGTSPLVTLIDTRMPSGKYVERYGPSWTIEALDSNSRVAVSGMDLSRDRGEIIVGYDSDQIYAFPIFGDVPSAASPGKPFKEEKDDDSDDSEDGFDDLSFVNAHCYYGGHLNCRTFLKAPKYAGPNDEYICTGSDSGHAFIFERKSGTVASLLRADSSTCNGVIPHPTLPIFATYGIDSSARLWRASAPVDRDVDDSNEGRYKRDIGKSYRANPMVIDACETTEVFDQLTYMFEESGDGELVFPDHVVGVNQRYQNRARVRNEDPSPLVRNHCTDIDQLLRRNEFDFLYYRNPLPEDSVPTPKDQFDLETTLARLYMPKNRLNGIPRQAMMWPSQFALQMSLSRLRHQADRLGLPWCVRDPWTIGSFRIPKGRDIHVAETIPELPVDWIMYSKYFPFSEVTPVNRMPTCHCDDTPPQYSAFGDIFTMERFYLPPWLLDLSDGYERDVALDWKTPWARGDVLAPERTNTMLKMVEDTARLLKKCGNEALKAGDLHLAAKRYDKALLHCITYSYLQHRIDFNDVWGDRSGRGRLSMHPDWTPLVRLHIELRMNLALLFLKPGMKDTKASTDHSKQAIIMLSPFTKRIGKVMGIAYNHGSFTEKPVTHLVFRDAMLMESKANFRLGQGYMELKKYDDAIECFAMAHDQGSVDNHVPDPLIARRLREARARVATVGPAN